MTIVFASSLFRQHETGSHPETPKRLESIDAQLSRSHLRVDLGAPADVDMAQVLAVHSAEQVAAAKEMAEVGGGYLDPDTVVSPRSFDVALKAAGTACRAVDEVMSGRHGNALCLIRPPGHHATPDRSMGFCLFNNVAIAAKHAQKAHGVDRILIVDWDVHHGNGTQDIFYDVENVFFFSIHRFPFYPGTGSAEETGTGKGVGTTLNVPVAFGTSRKQYLELFSGALAHAAEKCRPDLILISAGFDAHGADPIGSLGLATEDFATMTRKVVDAAKTYCGGRIVSCLEGGYNLQALGESVEAHLKVLTEA